MFFACKDGVASALDNDYGILLVFEVLYERRCRSPIGWLEVEERKLLQPEMVQAIVERVQIIREQMLAAQSRQKSYADNICKPLEFDVGNYVFLKMSPLPLEDRLKYQEQPMAILDRQVKRFRSKDIFMVKVLWQNHLVEEVTWELEVECK
ncbi:Uncharacterized protein TCM_043468 [Theobroma cacao]|uniref:Chromo domain-containing protein n=1 Tax=Theobroma cacao TaxID=3641 RepID=A0A061FNN8_THECC|nr:Uncharacterized protein TCM_043468 [Theobroma cacao]